MKPAKNSMTSRRIVSKMEGCESTFILHKYMHIWSCNHTHSSMIHALIFSILILFASCSSSDRFNFESSGEARTGHKRPVKQFIKRCPLIFQLFSSNGIIGRRFSVTHTGFCLHRRSIPWQQAWPQDYFQKEEESYGFGKGSVSAASSLSQRLQKSHYGCSRGEGGPCDCQGRRKAHLYRRDGHPAPRRQPVP